MEAVRVPGPDGKPMVVSLDDWAPQVAHGLNRVTGRIDELIRHIDDLTRRNDALNREKKRLADTVDQQRADLASAHDRITRLESDLEDCAAAASELQRAFAEIDQRFTDIAGGIAVATHPGRLTEDEYGHHDLGKRYGDFVQQHVMPLALQSSSGVHLSPYDQAQVVAEICLLLFGDAEPEAAYIADVLTRRRLLVDPRALQDMCEQAHSIRAEARQLGRSQRWVFDVPDKRFDPKRQQQFVGSAMGHEHELAVILVVAPSYVVGDGTSIAPQQVFTVRRDAATEQGPVPTV
ncbi:hypothetical protein ACFV5G_17680 [Streptomyces sp. NPDC059766]|uniref:hypothetical protein n=1 Tax=Streptomyces sp. NPDC059766 TaxID=3346940 RepID=UPI003660343A